MAHASGLKLDLEAVKEDFASGDDDEKTARKKLRDLGVDEEAAMTVVDRWKKALASGRRLT